MASSAIPLRPRALALLIHEREIAEALDVYRGNLLWSVLASIRGLAKHELTLPTYGDKLAELRRNELDGEKAADRMSNQQVVHRALDGIKAFLPTKER